MSSLPCLVCGELHDPPACLGDPEVVESTIGASVASQLFRGALEDLVRAFDAGDPATFTRALDRARKVLGSR